MRFDPFGAFAVRRLRNARADRKAMAERRRIVVVRDELDGGYVATMPNQPGVAGQGETQAEAVLDCMAADRERREAQP